MRIGRTGVGQLARTPGRQRLGGIVEPDGATRTVRRIKVGSEFVRLDIRRGTVSTSSKTTPSGTTESLGTMPITAAITASITIASDSTEPLTADTIATMINRSAIEQPLIYRTPAITRAEASGYERCGFEVVSVLRLLTHDLGDMPDGPSGAISTGRGRANRIIACVEIDQRAFGPNHSFDRLDLIAALDATNHSRLRLVAPAHPPVGASRSQRGAPAGFAITGRAGNRGYLQRVAVDPTAQGHGYGTALVIDALRWCRRHRVAKVVVNTATDNHRALSLYRRLGFVDTSLDLLLMERRG